jgi:hypothetical protein
MNSICTVRRKIEEDSTANFRPVMIRLFTLISLTLLLLTRANAQSTIEVFQERDNAGVYTFYGRNTGYCPYTVTITFTQLSGLRSSVGLPYQTELRPGQQSLFKLQPQPNQATSFQYGFSSMKGCKQSKVDTGVVYLLPVSPGKQVTANQLAYLGKQFSGQQEPKDWYSLALKMNSGDTVFAARRGTVSAVRSDAASSGTELATKHWTTF